LTLGSLTPRRIALIAGTHMAAVVATRGAMALWAPLREAQADMWLRSAGAVPAYLCAFLLCRAIAADHARSPLLRLSWLLFSGDALMSILRFLLETPAIPASGARNAISATLISFGLLCMASGMAATWWALRQAPLGYRPLRQDYAMIALIALALPFTLNARYAAPAMWNPGAIAVSLLFAVAILMVLLGRMCIQMGTGVLSQVIRWIMTYMFIRCLQNVLIGLHEGYGMPVRTLVLLLQGGFPWIFAYACALRYALIVHFREADPSMGGDESSYGIRATVTGN